MKASRTHVWLESLPDWAWPGRPAPPEPLPPAWVPAVPLALEPALAAAGQPESVTWRLRATPRGILLATLLSALAAVCVALALKDSLPLETQLGISAAAPTGSAAADALPPAAPSLPTLVPVSSDAAGSTIDHTSFSSAQLGGEGSFYVYLPPDYAGTTQHYPVLYLLHGRDGHAQAFLEIGIQKTLDRLIDSGRIPPMIAVMVQDLPGLNNWKNIGPRHSESYVVEVQELVDRMLPTIPTRAARAIAGSSMGGFGAMHVALANPYRFSVVESWLGFFNGLEGELAADRRVIAHLGLRAFLYGAEEDPVAVPAEDPEFAAQLRGAGAQAQSAIYPGGHSLEKIEEHLAMGLLFAGRSLVETQARAAAQAGQRRAAVSSAASRGRRPGA